jgi:excisionase family DNA binding protein
MTVAMMIDERQPLTEQVLFTLDDVARVTRISRPHLEREIARGALQSLKIGRLRRVSKSQLSAWVSSLERMSA